MLRSLLWRCFFPRYSLRTLLALTLVVALVVHSSVLIAQRRQQARRQHFLEDVRAQLVVSQRIAPEYSTKLLNFVQRRITANKDSGLISAADQRALLKEVEGVRPKSPAILLASKSRLAGSP